MEILKIMREKYGLKQKDFAKKIDIQPTTYNQYETGVREPNIQQLTKIANFYNCSIDYLVGREEIKSEKKQPEQIELEVEGILSDKQKELLDIIKHLKDDDINKIIGYAYSLNEKEVTTEEKIKKLLEEYKNKN